MFRFTRDEKKVLLFILAALFIGTSVLYYKKINPVTKTNPAISCYEEVLRSGKGVVNINSAASEELVKIKHVGYILARRIISYREKYGPFERIEDIKNVKGVGEKTFEEIKTQIKIE